MTPDAERPPAPEGAALSADERRKLREPLGVALVLLATALAVAISVVRTHPPEDAGRACTELLDRYVELRARSVDPKTGPLALERAREEARARAATEGALERCTTHLTRSAEECALAASNDNQFEQCFP